MLVPWRAGSVIICVSLPAARGQWDWLKCLRKEGREMKKKNRKIAPDEEKNESVWLSSIERVLFFLWKPYCFSNFFKTYFEDKKIRTLYSILFAFLKNTHICKYTDHFFLKFHKRETTPTFQMNIGLVWSLLWNWALVLCFPLLSTGMAICSWNI